MSRPSSRRPRPSRRDRHGRGLRGRLVPAEVPLARTRAEQFDDLVLDDGSIPLARVLPAHRENGREVPPRIVVYRRPLEIRAHDRDDLAELVRDVVVDQVAVLLGRDPDEIDPTG